MEQFDSLIQWLEILVSYAHRAPEEKQHFFDQAFGAIQFAMFLAPAYEKELCELWDKYKEIFENCEKPLDNIPYS